MRLIPLLNEAQKRLGWLSADTLRELSRTHNIPLFRLQELVSFYPHFRTKPPVQTTVHVCRDMSCWLAGGEDWLAQLQTLRSSSVEVEPVSCLGRCDMAPAVTIAEVPVALTDLENVKRWVVEPAALPKPRPEAPRKWLCDPYASSGEHYATLRRADGLDAIAILNDAGLRGMGGAGFPTGKKWDLVAREENQPKYVICNADESEPGTFKDREILADLPHLVIEGMALAAKAIGAARGILYIRHEYGPELERFNVELARAHQHGVLQSFQIDVFVSPGGYILGEETALLEALEDRRGEPRNKPPFPGTHGWHGQPTLINNVETFCMATAILAQGADWWRAQGAPGFAGLKFISVSGHVTNPGVYLVPCGSTVQQLIDLAGGMKDGRRMLAFTPGGASSNFLPAERAQVPLDFAVLQQAGSMLGSGALFVVAEGTDLLALAANVTRFFRNESCGKCVPCRVGSQKAVEILENVQNGALPKSALDMLPELGDTLLQTSICGLGQVAIGPALSILRTWPDLTRQVD